MALPSVYAALRTLDSTDALRLQSSIGGMAGCPYCGNGRAAMMIATEDLMHMLEDMGISTGVDLYKLIEVVWLAEEIVGHPLYGCVSKAGPRPRYDRLYRDGHAVCRDARRGAALPPWAERIRAPDSPWQAPVTSWMRPTSDPDGRADANGSERECVGLVGER